MKKAPSIECQTINQTLHTHQIQMGDNKLIFSIPHNFSLEFPMEPPPEVVSLDSDFEGEKVKRLHVWRAWWEFRTPGFFSREIGTLMLSIDIFSIHPDFNRDIFDRENFIEAMQINLINTYAAHNKTALERGQDALEVHLPQHPHRYRNREKRNKQLWITHTVSSDEGPDNFTRTNIPLNDRLYLSVSFFELESRHRYPELYTQTVRGLIGQISDSLYLERKEPLKELSPSKDPMASHDINLWPELG